MNNFARRYPELVHMVADRSRHRDAHALARASRQLRKCLRTHPRVEHVRKFAHVIGNLRADYILGYVRSYSLSESVFSIYELNDHNGGIIYRCHAINHNDPHERFLVTMYVAEGLLWLETHTYPSSLRRHEYSTEQNALFDESCVQNLYSSGCALSIYMILAYRDVVNAIVKHLDYADIVRAALTCTGIYRILDRHIQSRCVFVYNQESCGRELAIFLRLHRHD